MSFIFGIPMSGGVPPPVGYGSEYHLIVNQTNEAMRHYSLPASRETANINRRFAVLAARWHQETAAFSSVSQIAMHPAYQEIIGMGSIAVPLILQELQQVPGHWFWALRAITGADPVLSEHRGKVRAMAAAWIQWGKEHGHLR